MSTSGEMKARQRFRLPLLTSFSGYRAEWIRSDISAGLAIAAVGLPSAIAYPAIAGLPPETGIYASIWPPIAYALFGPSRQLIVGPDAATMTVLAAVLVAVFGSAPAGLDRTAVAAIPALGVGLLCLLARILRLWGPISLGVLNGAVIAIGATLVYVLHRLMYPRNAMLGRVPGRDGFYKLHRTAGAQSVPGLAICLIQGGLLFFNTDYVKSRLQAIADQLPSDTRWFVIDASPIQQIDSSAAAMVEKIYEALADQGIALGLADLHAEAREILTRSGVIDRIGHSVVFDNLEDAYNSFRRSAEAKLETKLGRKA